MSFSPPFTHELPLVENNHFSEKWEQFLEQITGLSDTTAIKVNDKERGFYPLELEILNCQRFFTVGDPQNYREAFRKVISTGTLPNAAPSAGIPHGIVGIDNTWMFTHMYGYALDPATPLWIPMPNGGPAYEVQIDVGAANIVLTTTANLTAFTTSYVVLEYLKY